jgi:hypothetical protein
MADKFDPYREALVMETETIWPEDLADIDPARKKQIAAALHKDAASASELEYVRTHTGFCRKITVTPSDVERVG